MEPPPVISNQRARRRPHPPVMGLDLHEPELTGGDAVTTPQRPTAAAAAAYLRSPSVAEIGAALSGLYPSGGGSGGDGAPPSTASPPSSPQALLRPSSRTTAAARPPMPRPRVSPVTSPGKRGGAPASPPRDSPSALLAAHAPTVSQLKRRLLLARGASKAWAAGDVPASLAKLSRTLTAASAPADAEAALAVAVGLLQRGGQQLADDATGVANYVAPAAIRSASDAAALVPLLAHTLLVSSADRGVDGGGSRLQVPAAVAAAAAAALASTFALHAGGVSAALAGSAVAASKHHHSPNNGAPRSPPPLSPAAARVDAATAAALLAGWDEAELAASRLAGAALSPTQHRRSGGGVDAAQDDELTASLVRWVREYRAWRTGVRVVAAPAASSR